MSRLLSMFMALSLFVTANAFAYSNASLAQMIKSYKVDIRVHNMDPQQALDKLTKQMVQSKMTKKELMDYVQGQMSEEEFKTFMAIVEHGKKELQNTQNVDAKEFQYILEQAITASTQNSGASYAGCSASIGFGVTAIVAGVVLGLLALDSRGTFNDDGIVFNNTNNSTRTRNLAIAAGITGAVGLALTIAGGSC